MRRSSWIAIPSLAAVLLTGGFAPAATLAQDASPVVGSCTVEPAEIPDLTAERSATPEPTDLPTSGPTADEETVARLSEVLVELQDCAAEGDVERLAALFTADGFVEAFAPEPVEIVEGTPSATPDSTIVVGEPVALPVGAGEIDRAFVLEDGRVAAYVDVQTPMARLVIFEESEDGQWRIDEIQPIAPEDAATPEDVNLAAEVPAEVWEAVVLTLGITETTAIRVIELEEVEWPDASLGCPQSDGASAQVITPGYRIVVEVDGEEVEIHTDLNGNAVICGDEQA